MLTIAHTISPSLQGQLKKIEQTRQRIILHPLPPARETSLQFQATMSRIVFGLSATGTDVPFDEVKKALTLTQSKKENSLQKQIIRYKQALDYIKRDWLVSNETIYPETLIKLHGIMSPGKLRVAKKELQEVLDYLQVASDNPFIQAAIGKLQVSSLQPFTEGNELLATLISYLFLYKAGLDCRGFLILEQLGKNGDTYLRQYTASKGKTNITPWLEYFTKGVSIQLDYAYSEISKTTPNTHKSAYDKLTQLNERQKAILNLLDNPNTVITNRTVQKVFKISQITASRDLVHLATLGLIFTQGRGRSVSYTRI